MAPSTSVEQKCDECTNDAEYLAVNGDDQTVLCGPDFADWIVDIIKSNAAVTLVSSPPKPRQLRKVELL